MANSVDLVIGKDAIAQVNNLTTKLTLADAELIRLSESARIASKEISKIIMPSGLQNSAKNSAALTAELEKQNKTIITLKSQLNKLKEAKKGVNAATLQEKVDARLILANKTAEAKAVSQVAGAYQKLSAQEAVHARAVQDIIARGKLSTQTQRQFNNELKIAQDRFDQVRAKIMLADNATGRWGRTNERTIIGFKNLGSGLRQFAAAFGLVSGVYLFASAIKDAYNIIKNFDKANADLAATMGKSRKEISALTEDQKRLGLITKFTAVEVSGLQKEYAKLGFSQTEILNSTEATLSLASAVNIDLATAANIGGATLRAFGLDASEMNRVVDVMAKSFTSSALDINTFKESMKYVAPIARASNISLEQSSALLAVLADNGIRGSMAGTSLRRIMTDITKTGKPFNEALREVAKNGISVKDAFDEVGRTAQTSLLVLGKNIDKIDDLSEAFDNAGGAAKKMADEQLKSLDGQVKILTSSYEALILSLEKGDGVLSQTAKGAVQIFTGLLNGLTRLNTEYDQLNKNAEQAGISQGQQQFYEDLKNSGAKSLEEQLNFSRKTISTQKSIILEYREEIKKAIRKGDNERAEKLSEQYGLEEGLLLGASNKIIQIKTKKSEEIKKIEETLTDEQIKAEEDRLKNIAELRKKELELQLANIDAKLNNEDNYYTDRLTSLDADFIKRIEIADLDYSEEFRLSKDSQEKQKIALVNFQLEKLKLIESYNKQKIALEKLSLSPISDLANSKLEDKDPFKDLVDSAKNAVKNIKTPSEKLKSDFKDTFNSIAESAQQAGSIIAEFSDRRFQDEYARLEAQKDISLQFAGEGLAARQKIEEDYEKKRREIANRENKAKQKQAIFNIAIDTAQAIMATVGKTGFAGLPLALILGALGAAQIAMVASQKIPKYFDGTDNHIGGMMLVNDGAGSNFQEKVILPNGKEIMPEGRNVLMNAPKGTKVLTHEQQIMQMLNERGISMHANYNKSNGMTAQEMDSVMAKHFSKIQTNNTVFDRKGFRSWSDKNGNKTIQNNNRVSRKGFNI